MEKGMDNDLFTLPTRPEEAPPAERLPLEQLAELAERQIQALRRIMVAAISCTAPQDWVLLGGQPFLLCSGAEKIARLFGISWEITALEEEEREDAKGKWILFTARGKFRMGPHEIEAVGTASTRSPFFGKVRGELRPLEEVDLPSVKKAAVTNCILNGIKRMLGLRTVPLDLLREARVDVNKIPRVEYKKGA